MNSQKRLPVGLVLLACGLILFLVTGSMDLETLSHNWDAVLSFLAGAAVGAGLPMIISGYQARKRNQSE